jgi:hypothetical protein
LEARLDAAYRRALARPPTPAEKQAARSFLGPSPDAGRWAGLYQVLFASLDFRYVN